MRRAQQELSEDLDAICSCRPTPALHRGSPDDRRKAPTPESRCAGDRIHGRGVPRARARRWPRIDAPPDPPGPARPRSGDWPARRPFGQQIGDIAVAPEQRDGQRRPAFAMRFTIDDRAGAEEAFGHVRAVGVRRLVQRRPSAIVRKITSEPADEQRRERVGRRRLGPHDQPARLTARFRSVLPFVPRACNRSGCSLTRAQPIATSARRRASKAR